MSNKDNHVCDHIVPALENTEVAHIKKISVALNKADLNKKVNNKLADYAKKVKIDGFRPGKAPIGFVQKRYGTAIYQDTIEHELNHMFQHFLKHNEGLEPISRPSIISKEHNDVVENYEIHFEVMPEYPVPDLNGISIELPKCELTEQDIDAMLLKIREDVAIYEEDIEAVKLGHKVLIDTSVTLDGQVFEQGSKKDFWCKINGGKDIISEFENIIHGMKAGETKVANVAVPSDYYMTEIAGKTVEFVVSVKKVEKPVVKSVEEYITEMKRDDIKTKEDLVKILKTNMEINLARLLKNKISDAVLKALVEKYPDITIPSVFIEHEVKRMAQQFNVGKMIDNPEIYKLLAPMAEQRIKPSILLQKFIESNKISAEDNNAFLAWIRKEYNIEAEKSDDELQKEIAENLDNLKYAYAESQAIAKLIESAIITEKSFSYKELSE